MPSFKPDKSNVKKVRTGEEPHDINQLGLDFVRPDEYGDFPRKELELVSHELLEALESRVDDIIKKQSALKAENTRLNEEVQRLSSERQGLRSRVDAILDKLEGL